MAGGTLRSATRRRGRRRSAPMAEINVTPFVDVMLVLLIIFMVAAPLLTVGVPLELPKTAAQSVPAEPEEPLAVSVTPEGPIMVMNTEVPEEELITRLRAVAEERTGVSLDGEWPEPTVLTPFEVRWDFPRVADKPGLRVHLLMDPRVQPLMQSLTLITLTD